MSHATVFLTLCCLLLAACSEEKHGVAEISEDNVFKGQVEALEKAKTVESTIQVNFDERKKSEDL